MIKMIALSFALLVAVLAQDQAAAALVTPGAPDFCIKTDYHIDDRYHKDAPSVETGTLKTCSSWQGKLSCCTAAMTTTLARLNNSLGLYNFTYAICDELSPQCAQYMRDQECFYWCEPMLGRFNVDAVNNVVRVPICAEYCNAWLEACQDDMTCITNWVEDLDYAQDITVSLSNSCPINSTCRTFREVYGNGEGLCNEMFGTAYKYSADADNCTVMAFDNSMPNPNLQLTFYGGTSTMSWSPAVMSASALLAMYLLVKTTM